MRLKAASLNAKDGQLGVEEMQIVFENMSLKPLAEEAVWASPLA